MQVETFFDPATFTLTYIVWDERTRDAVVIDPVLDYDPAGAQTGIDSLLKLAAFIRGKELKLHDVLETHAHADHLSGSQWLKREFGAKVAISERIREVQETFKPLFDAPFATDGSQFDRLLKDGETLKAGALSIGVIATPGHTPACVTFKVEDALFTGDALFVEDMGTGRCDFPRGSAADLYDSVHGKLYEFPDTTRVYVGHDYPPASRPLKAMTTIGEAKRANVQLRGDTTKEAYVALRTGRDKTLSPPRLLLPSVQVNVDAGRLPAPRANGRRYLATPLNLFRPTDEVGAPLVK